VNSRLIICNFFLLVLLIYVTYVVFTVKIVVVMSDFDCICVIMSSREQNLKIYHLSTTNLSAMAYPLSLYAAEHEMSL
jgi:hypothetical protein